MPPADLQQQHQYDVVVCGGGPAGFGAALGAARAGAQTLLIERLAHVGGMHTSAGVLNWCDTPGGPLFEELYARMEAMSAAHYRFDETTQVAPGKPQLDTELAKSMMMEMLLEAGVTPLLLTFCESAIVHSRTETDSASASDEVRGVMVVNKTGRHAIRARVVIDATADADIAASAGVPFHKGDPIDKRLQHCNFRVWYDGVDKAEFLAHKPDNAALIAMLRKAQARGQIIPPRNLFQPQADAFPFNHRIQELQLSGWEFENVDPSDALQVSRTLAECQVAALQIIRFCRENLPGHARMGLRKLPTALGTRESRRIEGRYTLTKADVIRAQQFEDGIAHGCFYMDLHDSPPGITLPHPPEHMWSRRPPRGDFYEIPYRCLLPRTVENLLVTGRCISADRDAHGSIRAMPTCLMTGHAAGVAAALALRQGKRVSEVAAEEIREVMGTRTNAGCTAGIGAVTSKNVHEHAPASNRAGTATL